MINKEEDKLFIVHEGQIVNTKTGEIISKDEFRNSMGDIINQRVESYIELHKELGVLPKFAIHKLKKGIFPCVSIKKNYAFNKTFRVKTKELALSNILDSNCWAFIGFYSNFLEFPTNEIMVNHQHLTYEELGRLIGWNKNKIPTVLKKLEEHEIIKIIKRIIKIIKRHKLPPVVYFNPFLFCSSKTVDVETYMMFENSIYNPKYQRDEEQFDDDHTNVH